MTSLTKEERQVVARRIFEALCTHYPDRYIALFEQPGSAEASVPDTSSANTIANSPRGRASLGPPSGRAEGHLGRTDTPPSVGGVSRSQARLRPAKPMFGLREKCL
jgi:hypothetical protein